MEDLGTDILYTIFSFLAAQDLARVSMVSTCFREVASHPSYWKRICREEGWRNFQGEDIREYGWRRVAYPHLRCRCEQCGWKPSFVCLVDCTRKCKHCADSEILKPALHQTNANAEREKDRLWLLSRVLNFMLRSGDSNYDQMEALCRTLLELHEGNSNPSREELLEKALHLQYYAKLQSQRGNTMVFVREDKFKLSEKGLALATESLKIRTELLSPDSLLIADSKCSCSGFLRTIGSYTLQRDEHYRIAEEYLLSALRVYEKEGDKRAAANALRSIGLVYNGWMQNVEKCLTYLNSAQELLKELQQTEWEKVHILQSIAYVYWNKWVNSLEKKDLLESLENHKKELEYRMQLMGGDHPITKRAKEDIRIILDRLLTRYGVGLEDYQRAGKPTSRTKLQREVGCIIMACFFIVAIVEICEVLF